MGNDGKQRRLLGHAGEPQMPGGRGGNVRVFPRVSRRAALMMVCIIAACVLPETDAKRRKKSAKKASASPSADAGQCADGRCSNARGAHVTMEEEWKRYLVLHQRMLSLAAVRIM